MRYRTLGKTGLKISEIGFGCWEIGGGKWVADDRASAEALKAALDCGINFFDTALRYGEGHSEQLVGRFAAENPDKGIIIATKVPPKDLKWPAADGNADNVFPKEHVIECAMKSYRNLGNRQIDLLQLHVWKDEWINEPGWQEAFSQLRKDGIIKYAGVSINDHSPSSAMKLAASGKVDALQVIYNIFDQSPADTLFPLCRARGVGVIARVPLDEGSLAGKFTKETEFADWRRDYFTKERLAEVIVRIDGLRWLENRDRTLAQAALQFCLSNPAVTTAISGTTSAKHIYENARATEGELSGEEAAKLKEHKWIRNFYKH